MRKKSFYNMIMVLVFLLLFSTGCSTPQVQVPEPVTDVQAVAGSESTDVAAEFTGGTLRIAVVNDPRSLNPIFYDDTLSGAVCGLLFDSLLARNEKNELYPKLAAAMPIVSPDGLDIIFELNKGYKWSDGTEVTAEDVKFSYELILDETVNSPRRDDFLAIADIQVVDPYTVKIVLSEVNSQILDRFADTRIVPQHILMNEDRKNLREASFSRNPVGNGPYIIDRWLTGERVILKSNPNYFYGQPNLDQVIYMITPSSSTALLKVETGEADLVIIPDGDIARIESEGKLDVYKYDSTYFTCVQYNVEKALFSDVNVRHAMSLALNREAMIKGILGGNGTAIASSYPNSCKYYDESLKADPFDVEKAKELLDKAGWVVGKDGIRVKDGKRFEFDMITNKGNEAREKAIIYLQSAYKEVGIQANPKIYEWNTLFDQYVDTGNFDAYVGGYSADSGILHDWLYDKDAFFNSGRYVNEEMQQLFQVVKGSFDEKIQKDAVYRMQAILVEDQPFTYLYTQKTAYAVSKKVKNVRILDGVGMYEIENWAVVQ
jgi:peptide/nickel transport system substrate-binding protein